MAVEKGISSCCTSTANIASIYFQEVGYLRHTTGGQLNPVISCDGYLYYFMNTQFLYQVKEPEPLNPTALLLQLVVVLMPTTQKYSENGKSVKKTAHNMLQQIPPTPGPVGSGSLTSQEDTSHTRSGGALSDIYSSHYCT